MDPELHHIEVRDGVLVVVDRGTDSRASALAFRDECLRLIEESGIAPAPTLIDLREARSVAPEAREVFQGLAAHDALGRIAYVTASTFMRVAATFVDRASGRRGETMFFGDVDEAMQWLTS